VEVSAEQLGRPRLELDRAPVRSGNSVPWAGGSRWSYALSLTSRVGLGDAAGLLDLEVSGRLSVRRFAPGPETKTAIHVQLEDAKLS
jgi:hypothetical protein